MSSYLLYLILTDSMPPIFRNARDETQLTNDLFSQTLFQDKVNNDGDLIFLNGMRGFNRRGNEERIVKF